MGMADACRRADLTVAVSDDDRRRLEELGRCPRAAIPTGVDTTYFTPGESPRFQRAWCSAARWTGIRTRTRSAISPTTILPRIRAEVPDASFTIVGRNPSARVRELAAPSRHRR